MARLRGLTPNRYRTDLLESPSSVWVGVRDAVGIYTIAESYERSPIKPVIDQVLPLSEAGFGHRRLEEGKQFGKIVLRPDA